MSKTLPKLVFGTAEYVLDERHLSIGRSPDNDIVLDHETVSQHHAEIDIDEDRCWLRDLSSTNGTRVNGNFIAHTSIQNGDILRFGELSLGFETGTSAVPPLPDLPHDTLSKSQCEISANDNPSIRESSSSKARSKKSLILAGCGCMSLLAGLPLILVLWLTITPNKPNNLTGGSATSDVEEIMTVVHMAFSKMSEDLNDGVSPSRAMEKPLIVLESVLSKPELSRCPPDFREAYSRYVTSMQMLKQEADNAPQSTGDAVLTGLLNGLAGEADGGYGRINQSWKARVQSAREAQGDLAAIAKRYGSRY